MPTSAENLQTIIDNIMTLIELKTADWIAAGMPPDFSLDGLSVNWASWLKGMMDNLKAMQELLVALQGPFQVNVRLRS